MLERRPDQQPAPVGAVGDFTDWSPDVHPLRARIDGTRTTAAPHPDGATAAHGYLAAGDYWFSAT
ncbi:hypothetical protein [Streptomyces sp. WAC06614]|uniref:hypothetical protein n=1 Tax=Streptomyces sp. WAC06614 TaxID=2487416 RepID=UPI000F77A5FE|nr:hypothetical protein [Streptomyces sp. WAC06614]RSS78924.1 hypothetical protein EF918_19210 [Streptomyces sp. WAC06614]